MAQYNIDKKAFISNGDTLFETNLLADKDGNVINSFGAGSNIPLANGTVSGYFGVHKFGMVNGTLGTGWSTVWTGAETTGQQLYPWLPSGQDSVVTVSSTSGLDITEVTIEGLDANYVKQTETITLTGATPATGNQIWHRISRAFMVTETNVGTISIENATNDVLSEIKEGRGQTLQAFYTVPAGCTAFLNTIQMISSKATAVEISMFARPFGGAFRVVGGSLLYQMDHTIDYAVPIKFTEKTDIDIRTIGANNGSISVSFDLIVVENQYL